MLSFALGLATFELAGLEICLHAIRTVNIRKGSALNLLFKALGLSTETYQIPVAGFSRGSWERSRSAKSQARLVCIQIFSKLCKTLCPSDSKSMKTFFFNVSFQDMNGPHSETFQQQAKRYRAEKDAAFSSLAQLCLSSSREAASYARSFLVGNTT